jgi:hypothetical protein
MFGWKGIAMFLSVVFWLIGANAPIIKIHFKCISKNKKNE